MSTNGNGSELWVSITAVVGAITGLVSLIWQIRNERQKIVVEADVYDVYEEGKGKIRENLLVITAYNRGKYPVRLKNAGMIGPKRARRSSIIIKPEPGALPITLMPAQETYVSTELSNLKNTKFKEPFDTAYFSDAAKKVYFPRVPLLRAIRRRLWLRFGK